MPKIKLDTRLGVCANPKCRKFGDLVKFKGEYICDNCLVPEDPKQDVISFLKQRPDAYIPENTPQPGLNQHDIVAIQRGLNIWSRNKKKNGKRVRANRFDEEEDV